MSFALHNIWIPEKEEENISARTLIVNDGIYQYVGPENRSVVQVELYLKEQVIAFPGLVNSHDHLDFNILPILKSKTYQDYFEWAMDLHHNKKYESIIRDLEKYPSIEKIKYGLIKNLICGVTTVVNHGKKINKQFEAIDVHENCTVLHSPRIERMLPLKINLASGKVPITIHIGEGKSLSMHKEINEVFKINFFNKEIVGIHGIAMDRKQARKLKALVWCPDSNYVLYGTTAAINELRDYVPILFGTDSTLTSHWNIWEHIRLAKNLNYLADEELFNTLTTTPAAIWNLPLKGKISVGNIADLVIAKKKFDSYWDSFYRLEPEDILAIFKNGNLVYFDDSIIDNIPKALIDYSYWSKITLGNTFKYLPASLTTALDNINRFNVLPVRLIETDLLRQFCSFS